MAQIILRTFSDNRPPAYLPTAERAGRLAELIRAEGIAAQAVLDLDVTRNDQSCPRARKVVIEVSYADFERARAIVAAAG